MDVNDRRLAIGRFDLDRGMRRAGGRPADQKGQVKPLPLHFAGQKHHFIQRWGDKAGQADNVGLVLTRGLQNLLRGHHHAQIHHVIAVTLQDDADNILADIVHIAFDRRHNDKPVGFLFQTRSFALGFHVGEEMGDGLFHDPG